MPGDRCADAATASLSATPWTSRRRVLGSASPHGQSQQLTPRVVRFGVFELDRRSGELRKDGRARPPAGAAAAGPGGPAGRARGSPSRARRLRQRLWPDETFVDFDNGLNRAINRLRAALGDEADNPRFIETLERRGYRFIAPVARLDARAAPPAPADGSAARPAPCARQDPPRRAVWLGGRGWRPRGAADRLRAACFGGTPTPRTAPPSVPWPSCRSPT